MAISFRVRIRILSREVWTRREVHRCFPVDFTKFFRTPFLAEHLRWLLLLLRWLLLYFFLKKYYLTAILQPCYDVWIIFSFPHIVGCVKSRTRLFINLSSIVRFSNWIMCHIKLKIGVIDHMNNIFETPFSRYLSMCL